jgi:hypothetical protein
MLKMLQEKLPEIWTNEFYSVLFNSSPVPYKDFDHALKHVLKAAVRLQEMTEEADHSGVEKLPPKEDVEKYLADLVICAVRLAIKSPVGEIDLEQAIRDRIRKKMYVDLP